MALKNWTNGDVFYGSDMDDLVKTSNMRFTNVAQRTATLVGDLAPTVGMMTVAQDTNVMERYIDVAGAKYWAPQPETLIFRMHSAQPQSIPSSAATLTTLNSYNNVQANAGGGRAHAWFNATTGRFTPQCPGYYEFAGATVFYHNTENGGLRQLGLRFNGAAQAVVGSVVGTVGGGRSYNYVYVSMPGYSIYMNGTTDYAELGAFQNSGVTLVAGTGDYVTSFSGKYLGR